ncbi:MAG: chitobiase/beta-hexosaminidase C-terminal domain-containing protein [Saprospiraceae bacterium]
MDINPAYAFFDPAGTFLAKDGQVAVALTNNVPGSAIRFTLDGTAPTAQSPAYDQPIDIRETLAIKAATFVNNEQKGSSWDGYVQWHQAVGKAITLQQQPAEKYGTGGAETLINGVLGSDQRFGDKEWLGFEGKDLEAVIDLGEMMTIRQVNCRFFEERNAWIFFPAEVLLEVSADGKTYRSAGKLDDIGANRTDKVATVTLTPDQETTARYLKVTAKNHGLIPEGYAGAGYPAWLFAGEIVVN